MKHITVYKWLSVMLVVLIMAAAIGCGKKEAEKATPTPTAIPTPTATPAEPTGETGSLSGVVGDVQVLRSWSSSWIAAISGMKIGTGDSLKTGSDGYVLITLFDGSVMEVEADSQISVEELSKTSGGSTTVRISQVLGNTINRVENLVDSSSTYEVETPAGSAVVRGTTERIQVGVFGRTCTTVDDEDDAASHSAVFTAMGVSQAIVEGFTSCCEVGGIPGPPFYTNPADDPLLFAGDGGGGSESACPPGCYPIEEDGFGGEVFIQGFFLDTSEFICNCPAGCYCMPPTCVGNGYVCDVNVPCCSGYCLENLCCEGLGYSCDGDADCCSGYCSEGTCCAGLGKLCDGDADCCSGYCSEGTCCAGLGESCDVNGDCCSVYCNSSSNLCDYGG